MLAVTNSTKSHVSEEEKKAAIKSYPEITSYVQFFTAFVFGFKIVI